MKEMRVANMELAAYFIISADGMSVKMTRKLLSMNGAYSRVIRSRARWLSTPTTTRSGDMKSFTAAPSLRNSGLEATSNSRSRPRRSSSSRMAALTLRAVPTGTVLLVTTTR